MSEDNSFVKFPRELNPANPSSPFYRHANLTHLFMIIVHKVRFGDETIQFKTFYETYEVKKSEFVITSRQLAKQSGIDREAVRVCVNKLIKLGIIELKITPTPTPSVSQDQHPPQHPVCKSMYTLTDKYFKLIFSCTTPTPTPSVSQDQHPPQHPHKKNVIKKNDSGEKEGNKNNNSDLGVVSAPAATTQNFTQTEVVVEKHNNLIPLTREIRIVTEPETKSPPVKPKTKRQSIETVPSDVAIQIAKEWLRVAELQYPRWVGTPKFSVEAFAQELSKVQQKTKMTDQGLRRVYDLLRNDTFWVDKVLPSTLLKKTRDGLTKLDHIMKKETRQVAASVSFEEKYLAVLNRKDEIN